MGQSYSAAAFFAMGAVALGIVACGGQGGVAPVSATQAVAERQAPAGQDGPAERQAPADRHGAPERQRPAGRQASVPKRAHAFVRPLGMGAPADVPAAQAARPGRSVPQPIADEALQIGHAYPHHESWTFKNASLDPSCGELEWSYANTIPGVTVTVDPVTTSLTGSAEVSFSELPDKTDPGAFANVVNATCTNPKATGTLPGPTPISVAAVSLDIAVVPQDSSDGTIVTDKTFTAVVGKFVELDASPEPEVTLLQSTWKLPGDTVKSYTQTKAKASYETLDASDLTQQQLNFYWIHQTAGQALPVPVAAVFPVFNTRCAPGACSGSEAYWGLATAESSVNVEGPTVVSITSHTGVVAADAKSGVLGCVEALHFGYFNLKKLCAPSTAPNGIRWAMTARVPFGGAGDLDATQLIRRTDTAAGIKGVHPVPTAYPGTGTSYDLDTCIHYGDESNAHQRIASGSQATYVAQDSPGFDLEPAWSAFEAADSYVSYFVYKPADVGAVTPDRLNIWVPIGSLAWKWSGTAENASVSAAAPDWHLEAGANAIDPKGTPIESGPLLTWTKSFDSSVRTCPAGG